MHRLWKIDIFFDNFICSGKTFQICVPEYDKLSLNNSLFGFGVITLYYLKRTVKYEIRYLKWSAQTYL